NGKWAILGLANGPWGILIQKEGYIDSEGRIGVEEHPIGPVQPVNITLRKPTQEQIQAAQAQQAPSGGAQAKAAIEKANAKLPQGTKVDPAIGLNVGIKAFNEGKMDAALKEFNDVIAGNPSLADAYYYRAMVYLNKSQNAQAKADLNKLLELDPNSKFAKD